MEQSPADPSPDNQPAATGPTCGTWLPLDGVRIVTLLLCVSAAAILLLPRVVWAPMFDDPGEVQLTAAVGGIGHPPGQAGIINIMRLLCLLSPTVPHLTVCAANAMFALTVVGILAMLQLRTGVHPLAACVTTFVFLTDDQFWHAAITTETYATCFALLAGAIWAFLSWIHKPVAWKVWLAAVLFLFLAVNRGPSVTFALPFLVAVLMTPHARAYWAKQTVRKLAALGAIAFVFLASAVLSLWVRDTPDSPYNYLEQSAESQTAYPKGNITASDKAKRLVWTITAQQFDYMFHPTPRTVMGQARWLITEFDGQRPPAMGLAMGLLAVGAITAWRCNRLVATFLLLMIPAGIVPILLIQVVSHTTLLPNLLFATAWLFGFGLSRVLSFHNAPLWRGFVLAVVCVGIWWTAEPTWLTSEPDLDARAHIASVDLNALPPSAILIDSDVIPLVYWQRVYDLRPDVDILVSHGRLNRSYLESVDRPVFTTHHRLPRSLEADLIGEGDVREIRLRASGTGG